MSYGEKHLVVMGKGEEDRAKNRRAHFVVE
jgi:outer membrane protein OmpA-like peptidoglycan-associated protein